MTEPRGYWEGCFPEHMEFEFDADDAMLWAPNLTRTRAKKCVIEVKRVSRQWHGRTKKRLEAIVDTDGDQWNAGDFNFVAYLWEGLKQGDPVAFLTFRIAITERTKSGRIDGVTFEPDLAYVLKAKRRRGLGKMIAAAFEPWLSACKVYGPRVKRGGVHVVFFAEYHSEGGGEVGEILWAHFEVIRDGKSDNQVRQLGWDIRETEYDAGF
jgi:hypothetical protein